MAGKRSKASEFGPIGAEVPLGKEFDRAYTRMSKPRSRRGVFLAKFVAYGLTSVIVLLVALNLIISNTNLHNSDRLNEMMTTQYNPSFKVRYEAIGAEVIKAWYGNGQPPVDLAQNIVWPATVLPTDAVSATGVEVTPADATKPLLTVEGVAFVNGMQNETPGAEKQYQETLNYVATINGLRYRVSVTLGIEDLDDYSLNPVLLNPPSLQQPDDVTVSELNGQPVGWRGANMSDPATAQLFAWAKAWTTNDQPTLKQIVQDPSDERLYQGLPGGWRFVDGSAEVIWSFVSARSAVVQLEWDMKIPDSVIPDPENDDREITITGPTQVQRMEILVEDYDTSLPAVVAWGPVGSYTTLEPYSNAVAPDEVTAPPSTDPAEVVDPTAPVAEEAPAESGE